MRRAAAAIRSAALRAASAVGLEGAFLIAGTSLLAYAASWISPAGPPAVAGLMCILAGIALALPERGPNGPAR